MNGLAPSAVALMELRGAAAFPTLAAFSNAQLLGLLGAITLVFAALATFAYRYFDHQAREAGMIDVQSNF